MISYRLNFHNHTKQFLQVKNCQIKLEPYEDNFTHLKGEIIGPPDTPYQGGKYTLDIVIPETYPFNPPKVRWAPLLSFSLTLTTCIRSYVCRLNL